MTRRSFTLELEADYQADLGPWKIRLTRQLSVLGAVIYASHGVLDLWALPSHVGPAWSIRGLVVATLLGLLLLTGNRMQAFYVRHYTAILGGEFVILCLGLQALISLSGETDAARAVYPSGYCLILIPLFTWTFIRPAVSTAIGFLAGVTYVVAAIDESMLSQDGWPILSTNAAVIGSAIVIGLVSHDLRERLARSNYLLRHAMQRDLEMEEEARRQSEYVADHDQLTGLPNRAFFEAYLSQVIPELATAKRSLAVLFIDLDDFKPINDTHGHKAGDQVLRVVADRVRASIRSTDVAARLGGDEFVVALELPTDGVSPAREIAADIGERIAAAMDVDGSQVRLTASVGVAFYPFHGWDAHSLVAAADHEMYEVKRRGKHGVGIAPIPLYT